MFGGDLLLAEITPNVGRWPETAPDPLGRYLESLKEIRAAGAGDRLPRPRFADHRGGRARGRDRRAPSANGWTSTSRRCARAPTRPIAVARVLWPGDMLSFHEQRFALVEALVAPRAAGVGGPGRVTLSGAVASVVIRGDDGRGVARVVVGLAACTFPRWRSPMVTYWRLPPGRPTTSPRPGPRGRSAAPWSSSTTPWQLRRCHAGGCVAMAGGWPRRLVDRGRCRMRDSGAAGNRVAGRPHRPLPKPAGGAGGGDRLGLVAVVGVRARRVSWACARLRGDPARIVIAAAMLVFAIPWIVGAVRVLRHRHPRLGSIFRGSQPTPGETTWRRCIAGLHEGLAGTQLVLDRPAALAGAGLVAASV